MQTGGLDPLENLEDAQIRSPVGSTPATRRVDSDELLSAVVGQDQVPVTVAACLGHSPETLLRVYAQEIEHGQVDVAASLAARLDG